MNKQLVTDSGLLLQHKRHKQYQKKSILLAFNHYKNCIYITLCNFYNLVTQRTVKGFPYQATASDRCEDEDEFCVFPVSHSIFRSGNEDSGHSSKKYKYK